MTIYCLGKINCGSRQDLGQTLLITHDLDSIMDTLCNELLRIYNYHTLPMECGLVILKGDDYIDFENLSNKNVIIRLRLVNYQLIYYTNANFRDKLEQMNKFQDLKKIFEFRKSLEDKSKGDIKRIIKKQYPEINYNYFSFKATLINKIIDHHFSEILEKHD